MKDILMSILRNQKTSIDEFRLASEKLSYILASEAAQLIEKEKIIIETPFSKTTGVKIKNNIVIIPILRSGIAMLQPFLHFFEMARVGFIGLRRDEKTAIAEMYYHKLPRIEKTDTVLLIDPMLATGGSAIDALRIIVQAGALEENIIFASIIAATEGVKAVQKAFPKIKMIITQKDSGLNAQKFIVPGLGDFGDRYFGTPVE